MILSILGRSLFALIGGLIGLPTGLQLLNYWMEAINSSQIKLGNAFLLAVFLSYCLGAFAGASLFQALIRKGFWLGWKPLLFGGLLCFFFGVLPTLFIGLYEKIYRLPIDPSQDDFGSVVSLFLAALGRAVGIEIASLPQMTWRPIFICAGLAVLLLPWFNAQPQLVHPSSVGLSLYPGAQKLYGARGEWIDYSFGYTVPPDRLSDSKSIFTFYEQSLRAAGWKPDLPAAPAPHLSPDLISGDSPVTYGGQPYQQRFSRSDGSALLISAVIIPTGLWHFWR